MLHKMRAKAYLVPGNDRIIAIADINIDNSVTIRDCRLVKNANGESTVELPKIKNKDGTYTQTVQMINYQSVLMRTLRACIIEAYSNAQKGNASISEKSFEMEKEQFELQRQGVKAEIRRINLPNCPSLKAISDVTIDNWLVIKNIRLVTDKNGNIKLVMPQKTLPDGTRCDRISVKSSSLLEKMKSAVTQLYMRHDIPQQSALAKADDMYIFP